jgi:hypothetical protein
MADSSLGQSSREIQEQLATDPAFSRYTDVSPARRNQRINDFMAMKFRLVDPPRLVVAGARGVH